MFLIRAAFWLSLVIAFIPVNPADLGENQRAVSAGETIGAMQMAISDMRGFCERNPQSCDTGRELFSQFGAKARNGARIVHDFLDKRLASDEARESDPVRTGGIAE